MYVYIYTSVMWHISDNVIWDGIMENDIPGDIPNICFALFTFCFYEMSKAKTSFFNEDTISLAAKYRFEYEKF